MSNLTATAIAPAAEVKAVKPKAKPIKWTPVPPSGRKIVRLADMVEREVILVHFTNAERNATGVRVMGDVMAQTGDVITGHERTTVKRFA